MSCLFPPYCLHQLVDHPLSCTYIQWITLYPTPDVLHSPFTSHLISQVMYSTDKFGWFTNMKMERQSIENTLKERLRDVYVLKLHCSRRDSVQSWCWSISISAKTLLGWLILLSFFSHHHFKYASVLSNGTIYYQKDQFEYFMIW